MLIALDLFLSNSYDTMTKTLSFAEILSVRNPFGNIRIGSFGKTDWYLGSMTLSNETICLYFLRSNSTGRVKIDATFKDKKLYAVLENGQQLIIISNIIASKEYGYDLKGSISIKEISESRSDKDDINSTNSNSANGKNSSSELVDDLFLCMLNNPDSFADATLKCGSVSILVHRVVLSARSPVFAAMFKTQMQEGRDGVVDIVDIELDVLQAMLRYVYSGKTDSLTHLLAGDLVFAADKYQLQELKSICVEQLKSSLAANNVFRSLVIGDLLDGSLKKHAMDFICRFKTFSELEKTEEWKSLQTQRPALAMEVMMSIVKYLQEK